MNIPCRCGKRLALGALFFVSWLSAAYPAERAETERLIRYSSPPLAVLEKKPADKGEIRVDSFYEQSDILQGSRTGHWSELTNRFGYSRSGINGYVSISEYERFDSKDFAANIGSYLSFKDSYAHIESGFGWDVDYIYKFIALGEYGHKLYKSLYWQLGYNYKAYGTDDVHTIYPGLIYYFGDSYISADYGVSFIESRDTSSFVTVKGDFIITEFLRLWGGVAAGERLYDIYELDSKEERGYILFIGLSAKIYKGLGCRAGYSYSAEKPKFIKRSVSLSLYAKF